MPRATFAVLIATILAPAGAEAAFPGANGGISFTSASDGGGIFAIAPTGGPVTRISARDSGAVDGTWTADGRRLAYAARGSDGSLDVFVATTAGARLVAGGPGVQRSPSFSPDGAQLVFSREVGDGYGGGTLDLAVVGIDGTNERRLTGVAGEKRAPAWSPDGRLIAFALTSGATAGTDLAVVRPDGSGFTRLTNDAGVETAPDWAPDSSRLVYADDGQLAFLAGTRRTPLLPAGRDAAPAFSPDGAAVAFARETGGAGGFDLFTVSVTGTDLRRLTTSPGVDTDPSWRVAPGVAGGRRRASLSIRATRRRVSGRLRLPRGMSAREGCGGRVQVRRVTGKRSTRLRVVRLRRTGSRCTYGTAIRVRPGTRLRVRFGGNGKLLPARSRTMRVR